jgi:hypothetical protein
MTRPKEFSMTKITPALFTVALLVFSLHTAPGQATTFRTFVSAHGSDANACTLLAPCKTFAAALAQTTAGGIIDVLDPAGYGAVTITKSITINGRDWASILVTSGATAITINAGASDVINLRGLIIDGAGSGDTGIVFNSGGTLNIQNSVIRRFTGAGIFFKPPTSGKLFVSDTLVADNTLNGIGLFPSGPSTVTAMLNRVELDSNFSGLLADGTNSLGGAIKVTVADSVAANNANIGFVSSSAAGLAVTSVMLVRCVAVNNGTGVKADGTPATLRSAQSTVTGNATGWIAANGGTLFTYGDNNVDGNTGGETAQTPLATK